ncbi:MAG: hypothetical protein HQ475_00225 [SAR202 cluster bacterium]|nr:hypothetical protein [SAR202 cluster bacterium]
MFWLKSCPKCHGDLYDNTDVYGSYIDCLQCGHYLTSIEDAELRTENPIGKLYVLPAGEPIRVLADMAA